MLTAQMRKILEGILRVDAQIELPAIYDPEEEAEMAAAAAAALNIKSEPRDDDDNDGAGAGGAGGASPPPSGSSGGSGGSSSDAHGNGTSNGGSGDEMDCTKAGPSNAQSPLGRVCPSQIQADFIPPSPPDSNQGDGADEYDGNQTTYLNATTLAGDAGQDGEEVASSDKVEETPEDAPEKPEANSTGDTSDATIDVVGDDEEEEDASEVVSIGDTVAEEGDSGRAEAQFFPAPGVISKKPSRSNEVFFAKKSTPSSSSSSSSGIGGSPKKVIAKRPGGHLRDGGQSAKKAKVGEDDSDAPDSSDPEPSPAPSADTTLEGEPEYGDDIFNLPLPNPIPDWRTVHRGQIVTESKKNRLLAKRGQARSGSIRKYNYKPFESTITGYSKLSTVAAAEEEVDGEWPCPVETCGAMFARERSLNSHMSRAHNPNARFPCPEGCGKMLSSQTAIQKHLLSHRPEDQWPYQCR